jgi:hypothetical protein
MNTKYTRGPWTVNLNGKEPVVGFDCKDGGPLLPIAPVVSGSDVEMIHANAKLIAAAPELLEALIELLVADTQSNSQRKRVAKTRARTVIAKAVS